MSFCDGPEIDPTILESTWRFLRGLGCDNATADELTQETFLRAIERGCAKEHDGKMSRQWLFTVARNLFIDRCLRKSRAGSVPWTETVEAELTTCLNETTDREWIDAARHCTGMLAPRASRIVTMFYREDYSRREIATALGMTEAGVKTALQRARAFLKTCIESRVPCKPPKKNCSTRS